MLKHGAVKTKYRRTTTKYRGTTTNYRERHMIMIKINNPHMNYSQALVAHMFKATGLNQESECSNVAPAYQLIFFNAIFLLSHF